MDLILDDVERIESATNGAYLGFVEGTPRFVIKPALEERGLGGNPFGKGAIDRGFIPGEGVRREHVAFAVDFAEGWRGRTPKTELIELEAPSSMGVKGRVLCSVRDYIVRCEGLEPNPFDLEQIASLDIDEGAADRSLESLVVSEGGRVWRIDQGLTRGREADQSVFGWRDLGALKGPMSDAIREEIAEQDGRVRRELLEGHGLESRVIALELARIHLKKLAAQRELSFFDISCLLGGYPRGFLGSTCAFAEAWEDFGAIEDLVEQVARVKGAAAGMGRLELLRYAEGLEVPALKEIAQQFYRRL